MGEPNIYVTEAREGYWLASIPQVIGCNASGKTREDAGDYLNELQQQGRYARDVY